MKFFDQLKLLVWKNFTLRRRSHLKNIVELIWPLVLFLILVGVRSKDKYGAYNVPNSVYRPRALPSAGVLPFARSLLCDFRTAKTNDYRELLTGLPNLRSSSLSRLLEDSLPILANSSLMERLKKIRSDYQQFQTDQQALSQLLGGRSSQLQWQQYNLTDVPLEKLLKDPAGFQQFLLDTTNLNPRIISDLLNSTVNVQRIMATFQPLLQTPSRALPFNLFPFPGTLRNQQTMSLLLPLFLMGVGSVGGISGTALKEVICDPSSPLNLQEIINGPNVTEVKMALCSLNDSTVGKIGRELQNQLQLPNTQEVQNGQRLLSALSYDWGNLTKDLQALQPLSRLSRDFSDFSRDIGQRNRTFRQTLCGRSATENSNNSDVGNISTNAPQSIGLGLLASACGLSNDTFGGFDLKQLPSAMSRLWSTVFGNATNSSSSHPKSCRDLNYNTVNRKDTCSIINPQDRVDCGWPGISKKQCLDSGCCFDDTIQGERFCFYKAEEAKCNCYVGKLVRNAAGVTGNAGRPSYDGAVVKVASIFLKGQILYTPDNNITQEIINQIKSELSFIVHIKEFAYWWVNNTDMIHKMVLDTTNELKRPINKRVCNLVPFLSNTSGEERQQELPFLLFPELKEYRNLLLNSPSNNTITQLSESLGLLLNSTSNETITLLPESFDAVGTLQMLDLLFGTIAEIFSCVDHEYFQGYNNEESMVKRAVNTSALPTIASLVFESLDDTDDMPQFVKYKIRQDVDFTPATYRIRNWYWRPGPADSFSNRGYFNTGFLYLQDLIDRALMKLMLNETVVEPGVYLQEFPYPCYVKDNFVRFIGGTMPLVKTLAWIFTVAMIVKSVVHEKERRLKEVMKVMGLGNGVHWVAWFINSSALMLVTIIILVVILKGGRILWHSNPMIIFLFMFAFMMATIMLCFLITVFFARANLAAACGGIIFFLTYLPYVFVRWFEEYMLTWHKALVSLLSTTSFGICCNYIARYEEQGVGAQWSNLFSSPVTDDGYSLGFAIVMMFVDAVIYGLLTWYIEAILPGQYGIPRPWYFPFQKSYWFETTKRNTVNVYAPGDQQGMNFSSRDAAMTHRSGGSRSDGMDEVTFQNLEGGCVTDKEPTHLPLGCSIRNLVKIYKDGNKLAVDGLNLNLYEGQITSFLGHNGAGKTTTMSVLTGLFPPTSGTAIINGFDIRTDIDLVRKSLGICPQYNVLFDGLTVEEHLWFYASLKGMRKSEIPEEVEKFLKDVGLQNKRHELSKNLSGGMKRKLSVALAFLAGSKVVILDEPTAGVDPYARRGIWDLLLQYKSGRTVLLSTHHMDEADILGDRIAIISQGKLQCCGSSLFLKGHYGNGYYVTLTKKTPEERPDTARTVQDITFGNMSANDPADSLASSVDEGVGLDSVDTSEQGSLSSIPTKSSPVATLQDSEVYCSEPVVSSFIKSHIPSAQLVENVGSELTYVLPAEMAREGRFQDLFEELDKSLDKLHIGSYGVSDTTLEEVFLKVAEEADVEEEQDKLAAEMPKRRPSFRRHLSRGSRNSRTSANDFSDREQLLTETFQEIDGDYEEEITEVPPVFESTDGRYEAVDKKLSGLKLLRTQFWALLVKRFHHARRNRKGFLSQILLPAIFVCIAMAVAKIRPSYEMPPLELTTDMFLNAEPYVHYLPFALDSQRGNSTDDLTDMVVKFPGVGPACLERSCARKPIIFSKRPREPVSKTQCDCETTGNAQCPASAGGPRPSQWDSFTGDKLQNLTGRNLTDYLLKTYGNFIRRRYGGVSFGDDFKNIPDSVNQFNFNNSFGLIKKHNAKAWYNTKGYHAPPTFLNVLNNAILRRKAAVKGFNSSQFGISVVNHPMNYTEEQLSEQSIYNRIVDVLVAICVVFALSFVPASFVVYLVSERECKAKHLHLVSGVRPYIYWLSTYVWDLANYIIPSICCILIFLAFGEDSYTSARNFPPTLLLLLLYGWSITPLMYPASFIFKESSTAYIVLICVNLFIGINTTLITFILEFFADDQELVDVNNALKKVFLIFPNYCLGRGLIDLAKNQFMDVFQRFGINNVRDPFSWDITGRNILMMIIQGFLFFFITVMIEYRFFLPRRRVNAALKPLDAKDEDEDVQRERLRIERGGGSSDILRVDNLTKVYQSRKKRNVAVNRLCVGVPKGECFGLLGVNGAGKTTTFKMLTGDIAVTQGEAFVDGYSILKNIHNAHQSMGYCPQFDGLDDLLTAAEHLQLYARLRGVPEGDVKQLVDHLIQRMNLTQYRDRCAGGYSGGNKRKLSTAIALVGNPPIIFLDEPTTGMDPKARRFLWNVIIGIVKEGRTVILTSHSMEECESLCNRVAIMVNGQFKCLGSPQHLKSKYGDGYTVTLRVGGEPSKLDEVSEFITSLFPGAVLKDKHHNQLEYQFPSQGLALSQVFGHLEANRKIFDIEDYSVSQTTLDQVFINFAKNQTDGDSEEIEDLNTRSREDDPAVTEPEQGRDTSVTYVRMTDLLTDVSV